MALNQDFIGKVYPAGPAYEVGREKIREFAVAIGDMNPAYHDEAAARAYGHRDIIAPPTFPFTISMRAMAVVMFDPELGLDYSRVVHGEQRFAYTRPITAGDRLVVDGRADDLIVTGGENVWPAPVEAVLGTHPAVAEVAVVGRADAEWGQRGVAVVVPTDPRDPPELADLRAHAQEHLPPWAAPRELVVVEALARTSLGKVRRDQLA